MVGEGEEQGATLRRDRAEDAVVELVGGIGSRFQEYVSEWIASFDAAINGEYDAQRLVADASRMTTRMVRDTAEFFVSGFDVLNVLANMAARDRSQRPEKAEPKS
jgi:hypothetical protein